MDYVTTPQNRSSVGETGAKGNKGKSAFLYRCESYFHQLLCE